MSCYILSNTHLLTSLLINLKLITCHGQLFWPKKILSVSSLPLPFGHLPSFVFFVSRVGFRTAFTFSLVSNWLVKILSFDVDFIPLRFALSCELLLLFLARIIIIKLSL